MSKFMITKDVEKREVTLVRTLDGPQELVWRCLTTPEHIDEWWGPEGWHTETKTMSVQPGGTWHYRMYGNGMEVWGLAEYKDVMKPDHITYIESASNRAGDKQLGRQQHVIISLTPEATMQTRISIRTRFASLDDLEAMIQMGMADGYAGALDKLESIIKKENHGTN